MGRVVRDTSGQATFEAAIILPLIAFLAFLGMQALWSLQCGDALTSAIEHVRNSVRVGDECSGEAANAHVKRMLIEAQPLLAAGELEVAGACIKADPPEASTVMLPDDDFDEYRIATKSAIANRVRIVATITYKPPALFWPTQPVYGQNVDTAVLVEERFEVG